MKTFDRLIRVSKASITEKLFDVDVSKLSKKELKKVQPFLPTQEELDFMTVYRSNLPELARLQRKMSVCLDVEVLELEEEKISFKFGPDTYTLIDPRNAYKMAQALERGVLEALAEMAGVGCILKNGVQVTNLRESSLAIDELQVLKKVANKFFFQISLA